MDIQCPKCFSKKYTKMGSQDYKCKDCGHTYDVDDMKAAMSKDNGEKFRKAPGKQHENIISKIDKYLQEDVKYTVKFYKTDDKGKETLSASKTFADRTVALQALKDWEKQKGQHAEMRNWQ